MNEGDEMRRDAEPSAVRILPADDFGPIAPPSENPRAPQRWFVPILVFAGVLAAFIVATRPATTGDAAAPATMPPPLAELNAEQIDISTPVVVGNTTGQWLEGNFDHDGQVNGFLRSGSSSVAVGWTPQGGQAWTSRNGTNWNPVASLEVPESAKVSLNHAVTWQGDLVVLGGVDEQVGLWTTDRLTRWEYQGTVEPIGTHWISGLAAGAELLAISPAKGTLKGWMSSDGLEWRPLGRLPVLEATAGIETLAATDDWYFAGGADCEFDGCSPVIYRSADGLNWEPAAGELPDRLSAGVGVVMDITATAEGLVAVGELERQVAIWKSRDGAKWEQIGMDAKAFAPATITIEVIATRPGDNPVATIALDGIEHQVTVGSEIMTAGGPIAVGDITDSYIIMGSDESRRRVLVNTSTELTARNTAWQIIVEGPRLVIAGSVLGDFDSSAAIWTSGDAGVTWDRTPTPTSTVGSFHVAMAGQNIVALGGGPPSDGLEVWRTTWDTTAIGEAATEALGSYLNALAEYDTDALTALIPQMNPDTSTPRFEIPSLGLARHHWWDADTGMLQPDKVADTVDYLQATDMTIDRGGCTPSVSLGATDRVSVTCDFQVDSDLLSTLGFGAATGKIQAVVVGDQLISVAVNTSPSDDMWKTFSAGIIRHIEADRATVFAQNDSGAEVLAPTFNKATASTHIRLAQEFVAGLLRPGETKTTETAFGTMEWVWIDPIDLPVHSLEAVSWSDLGFIATAHGIPGEYTEPMSVWTSPDGIDWTEAATPSRVESVWSLQPFLDGVVGQGWVAGRPSVVYFDGTDWTVLELPRDEVGQQDLMHLSAREDRALVVGGTWGEESGPSVENAWIMGPDLVLDPVDLPPLGEWTEVNVGLAADDNGFILSVTDFFDSRDLSIWHTTDGSDWRLIAESAGIEDASYLWNLQQHRSQYFVVGEGMEMRCTADGGGGEICESAIGLWTSPDGVAWDRVLTQAGAPVAAYEIGSGELGLVAFGQPLYGTQVPRPVYFSADGQAWQQPGGLALLYPNVDWWWINQPAVSANTVIATGNAYREGENAEHAFVLVGRLVARSS
jgi:hypothetical protein